MSKGELIDSWDVVALVVLVALELWWIPLEACFHCTVHLDMTHVWYNDDSIM